MELLLLALVAVGAIETTYLVYKSQPKAHIEQHSLLLDTSVLIDGRILPIARSGLMTAPVVIPRSVVRELQYMADKADHDKRERAREGLDMIDQLQHIEGLTVKLIDDPELKNGGVDERLVELAIESNARLCTIDYNLNKAARVQGVIVVNINELAHALRIVHLPGETVELKLVQAGQESRQAVGYLDDGTMVVVDDAKAQIGHVVEVEVTRVLQTAAGKMMFARKVSSGAPKPQQNFKSGNSAKRSSKAKNDSVRTTSKASMVANNAVQNDTVQITNNESVVAVSRDDQRSDPVQSYPNEQFAPKATQPTRQKTPPVAIPVPEIPRTPARDSRPANSQNQNNNRRQNPRRPRQSPEDSFIEQLTKQ